MRTVIAIASFFIATASVGASDRDSIIETIGALSIAPQICGIDIDRAELRAVGAKLLPEERELSVHTFEVNSRIAAQSSDWSTNERSAYCAASTDLARTLDVLR